MREGNDGARHVEVGSDDDDIVEIMGIGPDFGFSGVKDGVSSIESQIDTAAHDIIETVEGYSLAEG